MNKPTCKINACDKEPARRGMCSPHYRRALRESNPPCTIAGCNRKQYARGWCNPHYKRWWRHGAPHAGASPVILDPEEAFAARTEWRGDCLIWTGGKSTAGYGGMVINGEKALAHRYAWERAHGPIPDGLVVDHLCHTPPCVNVEHLRLATNTQNITHLSGAQKTNVNSRARNVYRNHNRWMVMIQRHGVKHYRGTYDTVKEAAKVAEAARRELFGEFAGKG